MTLLVAFDLAHGIRVTELGGYDEVSVAARERFVRTGRVPGSFARPTFAFPRRYAWKRLAGLGEYDDPRPRWSLRTAGRVGARQDEQGCAPEAEGTSSLAHPIPFA